MRARARANKQRKRNIQSIEKIKTIENIKKQYKTIKQTASKQYAILNNTKQYTNSTL